MKPLSVAIIMASQDLTVLFVVVIVGSKSSSHCLVPSSQPARDGSLTTYPVLLAAFSVMALRSLKATQGVVSPAC